MVPAGEEWNNRKCCGGNKPVAAAAACEEDSSCHCPPGVELPDHLMNKDALAKSIWGKEMEGFDMDSSWLDRLDMGLDFTDILADGPSDGLVPSFHDGSGVASPPIAAPAVTTPASPELAVPSLSDFDSCDDLQVPSLSADMDLSSFGAIDDFTTNFAEYYAATEPLKMASLESAPVDAHFALDAHMLQQVPQPLAAPDTAQLALQPSACMPPVSAVLPSLAAARLDGTDAFHITIPNVDGLTRAQRVARYREKRTRRQFAKVVRYASRKAYAEVRPRIKGRFAKREEVAAWKAAEAAMRGSGCDMLVPCM